MSELATMAYLTKMAARGIVPGEGQEFANANAAGYARSMADANKGAVRRGMEAAQYQAGVVGNKVNQATAPARAQVGALAAKAQAKANALAGQAGAKAAPLKDKATAAFDAMKGKGQAAIGYVKAHPGKAGLAAAVGAGVLGAAGYAANQYNQNKTAGYEDPMEELYLAKQAAEELYNDCIEKMAFAEQLFAEADYVEKQAADNGAGEPVPWINQVATPVGATTMAIPAAAGAVAGAMLNKGRGIPTATAAGIGGAILGAGVGAGALAALNTFSEHHRMARAQANQANSGHLQ